MILLFKNKFHRHSLRLKEYDYSSAGVYFVTVCAHNRECLFGDIIDGEMVLNDAGKMVERCWLEIPDHYPSVELDEFVIMPNHFHGILYIHEIESTVGAPLVGALEGNENELSQLHGQPQGIAPTVTLGKIVGEYKSLTTLLYVRGVNELQWKRFNTRLWQRNYYEHIIRDESDLNRIREYIINNPARWQDDEENPFS